MAENQYLKLSGNYYFDPVHHHILKKQGNTYTFVRHDRRIIPKPVNKDRRSRFETMPIHLKPIAQGLFWDAEGKNVYRKVGGNFVLYSKDRRRQANPVAVDSDRRQKNH
jgi:hypothetical protein